MQYIIKERAQNFSLVSFKMVCTITGEVRPENQIFHRHQTITQSLRSKPVKRYLMSEQSIHIYLFSFTMNKTKSCLILMIAILNP